MVKNIFALSVLLSTASALVVPPAAKLNTRQESDCSPSAPLSARCWQQNGVEDWLKQWNSSTPLCPAGLSNGTSSTSNSIGNSTAGKDCCFQNELWSKCFLRLRYQTSGHDCSVLNPQSCSWDSIKTQDLGSDPNQKYYILRAIYTINNLMSTYYTALNYAVNNADLIIQDLVNQVDELKAQSPLLDLLSALIAGLGFLGLPSIGAGLVTAEIGATVRAASQGTLVSLQQAPGLVKGLWPSGTTDSRQIQVGNLGQELSRASADLTARLTAGLSLIMSDVPTFLQFSQQGSWTTEDPLSIPNKAEGILYAFHNYLTSQVLNKNGWYAYIDKGSLDYTKYPNISALDNDIKFQGGVRCDNVTNICDKDLLHIPKPGEPGYNGANWKNQITLPRPDVPEAWWWSPATHRVYTIKKKGMSDKLGTKDMLQKITSQNWGKLDILFDGSFNCTYQGRGGSVAIDLSPDGNLDMSCISQLPIKRECTNDPCLVGSFMKDGGKTCPFEKLKDCDIKTDVKWPPGS